MKKLRTIEMQRLTVEEFREAEKLPLVVVLDDVRSMHNVGSVFRTGDAFRIEAVYLCGITSTPPSSEIHKTALGAEDSVAWHYYHTALEAVESLKAEDYEILSIEQAHGSTMLQDFTPQPGKKYAVVLKALRYFGDTSLDFADCLLCAYHTVSGYEICTFDKKLNNFIMREDTNK